MQLKIEDMLGSRNKVKLLRYLSDNLDWQFNLSSISMKIGVDKGALSRLIKELENLGVIEVKREGKLLLFRVNAENKLISDHIFPLFAKKANFSKKFDQKRGIR